ncbi:MAG: L-fucose:H+ symporter permease [Anaerostipes sp.]|nr:L-fucose:H+ symporter permease [Anaerostipes sp.]
MNQTFVQRSDGYLDKTPWMKFILVGLLFGIWGTAVALNSVLIAQFKEVFVISNVASALIQSAYFGAYFLVSLPTSMIIKKYSYKVAIVIGIALFAGGSLLFYPASIAGSYLPFLMCIFIMAIGAGMLEMSCGTYVVMMGNPEASTLRSSIAQTINPIGNIVGIALGKVLIFSEATRLSDQMSGLTKAELHSFQLAALQHTIIPYMIIAGILLILLLLIMVQKYPSCKVESTSNEKVPGTLESVKALLGNRRFVWGWVAQFCGIGAQLTIWSFLIRQVLEVNPSMAEAQGTNYMMISYVIFFAGRFVVSMLLKKGATEYNLLSIYLFVAVIGLGIVMFAPGNIPVFVLLAINLVLAPIYPVLYATNVANVERKYTENAGAFATMTLVGGAIFPIVQGKIADIFSLQFSFIVPALGFVVVLIFALMNRKEQQS